MKFAKCFAVIIFTALFIPRITLSEGNGELLVDALLDTGASPAIMDIADWSVINREYMSFSQMENHMDVILNIFDVDKNLFKTTKENSEMYRILNMEGKLDYDTFLQIVIHSVILPEEYEKEPQTYLVVSVSSQKLGKYADYIEKVTKSIINSNGQSKITSCVTGTFNGKLDEVQRDQILKSIYDYLKITDIEKTEDEYFFSITGLSQVLPDGIEIMGKNRNINISMRHNTEDDKTYLWIGTPVISIEY